MDKSILDRDRYWLYNAQIPLSLFLPDTGQATVIPNLDNLVRVDLEINRGLISNIRPVSNRNAPGINLNGGQIWCCFVDVHTHLDKGHIWERTRNLDGTFSGAIASSTEDAERYWNGEDIYHRMSFGLRCSYAYGTQAIRTHLDMRGEKTDESWDVFSALRHEWSGKIELQGVLFGLLDDVMSPLGEKSSDRIATMGGILGGVLFMNPDLDRQLDRLFAMASDRNLDLDLHVDESLDPNSRTLYYVARAALRNNFTGQITCGHCCSLSVQSPDVVKETLDLVKAANIAIVSLPMCNLYLQNRHPGQTPRARGVTLLKEISDRNIPVMVASDNCRDPFFGFGDHDGLEVFQQAVRIAHLDTPYGNWPNAIATTPGEIMNLVNSVAIGVGLPANLILFKGRGFSELLSRPQCDRVVLRQGKPIDTTLPDYAELDDLMR
ncbi:cytosine deaminase [Roseofilum casamattae]|uniref:Cytosine deaminase n=1 Tax=Roseofilum casamattae BLCC-M143 TaxID=3022442 RepID=A0ABT7BVM2_9CYAN|nr:cytosine deaminase [Roseofilum casamattae]MDJ1183155.1 cytosine deaminase [Roseofilum casamattae BLCC-M143]